MFSENEAPNLISTSTILEAQSEHAPKLKIQEPIANVQSGSIMERHTLSTVSVSHYTIFYTIITSFFTTNYSLPNIIK